MIPDRYAKLNERQWEAVRHTEGPLLILAGAGSGKTNVLTHRIAYLIDEVGVAPYEILAITFTNKAAEEMKRRVTDMVDYGDAVWVATFHSTCARILRRHIGYLGYETDFTIYDADDQRAVVRHVIKDLNLDPKLYKERQMVAFISDCKTQGITPGEASRMSQYAFQKAWADIYKAYEKRLKENNALDFDDLLLKTVELFRQEPDVIQYYRHRFRYIMVDEYQDTNHVQFELVELLAHEHHNLCVVGDDDQSIYRFRGADIRNILDFEKSFPEAKVVKLEQNYRSTTHILDVANAVIKNNRGRKEKHLWSALGEGAKVTFRLYETGKDEAADVVRTVLREVRAGRASYKDFAVLYRTNAQSRLFEERCVNENVPYALVGGVNFYQREEIKDILAYLRTVQNGRDDVSTERIVNKPRRGIGDTSIGKMRAYALEHGLSLMEAIAHADQVPGINAGTALKFKDFAKLIKGLREDAGVIGDPEERLPFAELVQTVAEKTGYYDYLDEYDEDRRDQKLENIDEFISKAEEFENNWDEDRTASLQDFLEEVALVADVDALSDDDNKLLLMTLHSSKGLEFPTVFLTGMEEGLFPSYMSQESPEDVEEERRLCYVGITRAKKVLHLSAARTRMVNGSMMYNDVSRFVKEIPEALLDQEGLRMNASFGNVFKKNTYSGFGGGSSYGPRNTGFGGSSYGPSQKSETRKPPEKPAFGLSFPVSPKNVKLDFEVGDRVVHTKFGSGTVTEIVKKGEDYKVAADFDQFGRRVILLSSGMLKKEE
ncbi:MAG: UvrD-helicase domain-containing protein [Lachnospiraceae bacterium]|nr:UvrD-helicase domain-containing protein [Lachnospiraceae bacterium]